MKLTYEELVFLRLFMHDAWHWTVQNKSESERQLYKSIHQKLSQELLNA